ncbi:MAG: response regulator [Pseudomonadota bacterium]|nr:response regulator [Pseudomonadota bacterium]
MNRIYLFLRGVILNARLGVLCSFLQQTGTISFFTEGDVSRIIFADDDELVGEIVRAVLSREGHVVGIVPNGDAAVRAIILKAPDLVIMDVMMPGMSGVEAVRQIRASATAHSVPILMLSARRNEADVEIALRAGADDYLKKPFDPDQLLNSVERLLERRKQLF